MTENPYQPPVEDLNQRRNFPELYQILGIATPLFDLSFSTARLLETGNWPSLTTHGQIIAGGLVTLVVSLGIEKAANFGKYYYDRYQFNKEMNNGR